MKNPERLLDEFNNLPDKAKLLIIEHNDFNILSDISIMAENCNSPIEKIFATAYEIVMREIGGDIFMQPQTEINCGDKTYIVDFTIGYDEICNNYLKKDFNLIIECDGFEYHHKTKKQVDYDNKREYDLKMAGYDVIRFSGSEIYKNPKECVIKIIEYLKKNIDDK